MATVYGGVRQLGYEPCFMEDVRSFTPGKYYPPTDETLRHI